MKAKELLVVLCLFLGTALLFFYPFFWSGHLPFPGDLLVGHYAPWNSYSFLGYASGGVPHKAQGIDVVRELFPWKHFSIEMIKKGELPFWNPYNFSGNPHLANFQTGIFYPFNILFFILPFNLAWTFFIILQPLLASLFTYLFLREIKVSRFGSVLGSFAFAYCLYFSVWMEYGNIGHAILWLPLALFSVEKIVRKAELKWFFLLIFSLTFSILAGYIQMTIYLFGTVLLFSFFRRKRFILFLVSLAVSLFLSLPQLLPTWELFSQSARGAYSSEKIPELLLPWFYPVTVFASDFFGNPASRNYWLPGTYIERVAYVGVLPLFFAFLAVFYRKKEKVVLFFTALVAVSFLFSLNLWPIRFFYSLKIPIISTTVYTRLLSLFSFFMAILAGFGIDFWLKNKERKTFLLPTVLFGSLYFFLWLFAFLAPRIFPSAWWAPHLAVSRRNLILPTGIVMAFFGLILGRWLIQTIFKNKKLITHYSLLITLSAILLLTIFDLFFYFHKITPFSPPEFVYPETAVMKFIQQEAGINRFWGYGTAYIDTNFSTFNHTFSPEGNDPLLIRRYGELLAASRNKGIIPQEIPRADANLEKGFGREALRENLYRQRMLNLLGVKYLLHKDENLGERWRPDKETFPEEIYQLVWQEGQWQIYENKAALPRVFLVDDFEVIEEDQAIVDRLFSKDFDLSKTIVLEEAVKTPRGWAFAPRGGEENKPVVAITAYSPNRISLTVETDCPSLLFLSDNYYPGWKAEVDGQATKIYRANYSFRAIFVSEGKHRVVFLL